MKRKTLGIYIHIPFCMQKCLYCDFVSGPASLHTKQDYVNQILNEINIRAEKLCSFSFKEKVSEDHEDEQDKNNAKNYIVDTVFIGGGTPSVLDADRIKEILYRLKEKFDVAGDCECSIEVNPGTVDFNKFKKYREAGINRLSIGLQSCNDNELKALGRIHDYSTFEETYRLAREAGFENINVDLMSSIPEQTEESFIDSLNRVIKLNPEHISVYSLIVEENTPFYDTDLKLPDEEVERRIYHETGRILKECGYKQYEISNYAKPGKECRHNIRYWQCNEYIGFGVAAASYLNGVRWKNTENISKYIKYLHNASVNYNMENCDFYGEKELLTQEEKYAEFMFMGLRMNKGVSEAEFVRRFGCTMDEKYGDIIEKHIQNGLLRKADKRIMLTEKGRDICNYIMADFLL